MRETFTTQERWDLAWAGLAMTVAAPNDCLRQWIESRFAGRTGTCLEIGCFPGRYLAVFGELGYELHGIDLTPRVEGDLPQWLTSRGYKVGNFARGDAFTHQLERQYDVVCSFGLIEHFGDWQGLIRRHVQLTRPGGLTAISTPNFRGTVQRVAHSLLDRDNLAEHNLDAMRPEEWAEVVRTSGCSVVESGYLGRFDFWVGEGRRNSIQLLSAKVLRRLVPLGRLLPEGVGAYAPHCILIAQKHG